MCVWVLALECRCLREAGARATDDSQHSPWWALGTASSPWWALGTSSVLSAGCPYSPSFPLATCAVLLFRRGSRCQMTESRERVWTPRGTSCGKMALKRESVVIEDCV